MHEEVRKMVQSHHIDLATYAKSLDAAKSEAEAAKLAPVLKEMLSKVNTPMYIDLVYALALERMAKYRAHIRAGFTDAQALELCAK